MLIITQRIEVAVLSTRLIPQPLNSLTGAGGRGDVRESPKNYLGVFAARYYVPTRQPHYRSNWLCVSVALGGAAKRAVAHHVKLAPV